MVQNYNKLDAESLSLVGKPAGSYDLSQAQDLRSQSFLDVKLGSPR